MPQSTSSQTHNSIRKLGLQSPVDLLYYFPKKYLDFSHWATINTVKPGDTVTLKVTIKNIASRFSFKTRTSLAEAVVSDATGSLKVTWFHQAYLAKTLAAGDQVFLSGDVVQYKGLQLINPIYEKVSDINLHTGRLVPVYKLPDGIYNKTFRRIILETLENTPLPEDILPASVKSSENLPDAAWCIKQIHFPDSSETLIRAQRRMIFEEVFIQQLAVALHKQTLQKLPAPSIPINIPLIKKSIATLPFVLTQGQKKAIWDISQDLAIKHPMNRLLQGDVGSGKTVVAIISALQTITAGYQVAMLAPTEILAKQHYNTILPVLEKMLDIHRIAIFTRTHHQSTIAKNTKQEIKKALSQAEIDLVIGTHALLQETIQLPKLGLVIIDEQHRFGVAQRKLLTSTRVFQTDSSQSFFPHRLSMSATPIPRTLALSIYGDLDISVLPQKPEGRLAIVSRVVVETKRTDAYSFITRQLEQGDQVYIITPLVEESERLALKSAKQEYERLSKLFSKFSVGLVYGSMKGPDKEKAMSDFNSGATQVLVATSVIEIGIDVPNATVIVIEGAERFGLAQLHQLRGRVGRGSKQSYCLLFASSDSTEQLDRLQTFAESDNGFALAELDLKQRGFGSLFGVTQTGFNFRFSQFLSLELLKKVKASADHFLATENLQEYPRLEEKVLPLTEAVYLE